MINLLLRPDNFELGKAQIGVKHPGIIQVYFSQMYKFFLFKGYPDSSAD